MNCYPIEIDQRFGVFQGSMPCVFIKTGNGGTIYGEGGKYLSIAEKLHDETGRFVCVAANPVDEDCILPEEIASLVNRFPAIDEITYIGNSNGAYIGAQQAWEIDIVKRALLINPPLMINFHKTKEGAELFRGELMMFVYGDKDPSFRFFELLSSIKNEAVQSFFVSGADHNFTGLEDKFEELIMFFARQ